MLVLIVGLVIGFYILVVLSAFVLAIKYFITNHKEIPVSNKSNSFDIEYIPSVDAWYAYKDGKFVCQNKDKSELEIELNAKNIL